MKILYGSTIEHREKILQEIECSKPYYHPDYVNIMYRTEKGARPEFFLIKNGHRFVYYQYVRRDISAEIPSIPEGKYYDIITPFDYGGYYCNDGMMDEFLAAFYSYCMDTGVISEFQRLLPTVSHDINKIAEHLNIRQLREHIYIDLNKHDFIIEFNSIRMKDLRKSVKNELACIIKNDIKDFMILNDKAVKRKGAHEYYLFNREVLTGLLNHCYAETWYACQKDVIISSCLILKGDHEIYYFLHANDVEHIKLGGATFLLYSIARHYQNKKNVFLIGGGQNGVYEFKRGLSKQSLPYYTGYRIYNHDIYKYLTRHLHREENNYFPRYREKII